MKRIFTIPLMLLILFTGINVNIASHYCGGNFAATKVSLNGELASCGMEHQPGTKPSEDLISSLCCEDIMSSFNISTNYVPSSCCSLPDIGQEINHTFILYNELFISQQIPVSAISNSKRPPGFFTPVSIEQQVICVFQI
jgi:hypothetical protein